MDDITFEREKLRRDLQDVINHINAAEGKIDEELMISDVKLAMKLMLLADPVAEFIVMIRTYVADEELGGE